MEWAFSVTVAATDPLVLRTPFYSVFATGAPDCVRSHRFMFLIKPTIIHLDDVTPLTREPNRGYLHVILNSSRPSSGCKFMSYPPTQIL